MRVPLGCELTGAGGPPFSLKALVLGPGGVSASALGVQLYSVARVPSPLGARKVTMPRGAKDSQVSLRMGVCVTRQPRAGGWAVP